MSSNYYAKNKERILEKQKRKYNADPEYREMQKERTVASRKKKQLARKLQKEEDRIDKKTWYKFRFANDEVYECCRVGHLAKLLSRQVQTIKLWEKEGFPETVRKSGQRYYTRENINVILSAWKKHSENIYSFISEVQKGWTTY
jgi:DNA-binding transcriptional MerR regulator